MHLIVHNQTIGSKKYIRILALNKVESYRKELALAYDACDDTNIRIFYNCGDMCQRLISDLGYKKFKGTTLKETCAGLWCIETCTKDEWFTQIYVEWIQKKLRSYIEDTEDTEGTEGTEGTQSLLYYTIIPEEIQWKEVSTLNHAEIVFDEQTTRYKVLNYELHNDKIVLTKDHILSLIYKFVKNNYSFIASLSLSNIHIPINIDKTSLIYGCCIDKDLLCSNELLYLFSMIGINEQMLERVIKSKTYLDIFETELFTNISKSESNPYYTWYSYIDDTCEDTCENTSENAFNFVQFPSAALKKSVTVDQSTEKIIYKNVLNDEIVLFDKKLIHLIELANVSSFNYTTPLTSKIVESINKTIITQEFINELKQLVAIFDTPSTDKVLPTQKDLTQIYVDKYKNDAIETLASTVIDNVNQYLDGKITNINKNQIGKDLSEMGVKKNRKARGYVYGIEDTKQSKFIDYSKASKEDHQLRECVLPSGTVDVAHWLQPGRFLIPRNDVQIPMPAMLGPYGLPS